MKMSAAAKKTTTTTKIMKKFSSWEITLVCRGLFAASFLPFGCHYLLCLRIDFVVLSIVMPKSGK